MADFPAAKRNGSFGDVLIAFFAIIVLIAWIVAIIFLIHGAATQDLWEVIYGGVMIVVLLIIRQVSR